ncbi:MAG TPA: mucoidy inhibitor MuiA family protein [bacterium]|nr:mucoidy inhibitor MuiA family protein [Chlamydiota bacterium]HOE26836.1 mucoidy inhibitor MuiA family protein [bacterium]HQM52827.1 mucoidy inhibitor MuiA family protein [bacterium]
MKTWRWVAAMACAMAIAAASALCGAAGGKPPAVESDIAAVTVYADRARVTRRAELALDAGVQSFVFAGLPAGLIESSLRARGEGAAGVTILGTEMEPEYLAEAQDARVRELEGRIEALEEDARALEDETKAVGLQMKFVESIGASVPEGISKEMLLREPNPAEWARVVEFIGRERGALAPKLREGRKKHRDLMKEIEAAKKTLERIVSESPRERKNVRVTLEAASKGPFLLELSYVTWGAGWEPLYDARAERAAGKVSLTYCAQVRQATGEDWTDVALELSTSRPSVSGRPPELAPWYIGFERPRAARMMALSAAAPVPLGEAAEKADAAAPAGVPVEARVATAEIGRRGEAVTFTVKRKETIRGDNSLHKTVIAEFPLVAEYGYLSVPKLAEFAFLTAEVKNETGFPLLAGAVQIFLGPEFVGSSSIEHVETGASFPLYLGIDEGIRVKRKLLAAETEKGLVRRRTGWRSFRYRIEVENLRDRTETVTVLDQMPVSNSPDIAVALASASPEPSKIAEWETPGSLAWRLEPAPKEKKTVEFEFTVQYPKEREIEGLD